MTKFRMTEIEQKSFVDAAKKILSIPLSVQSRVYCTNCQVACERCVAVQDGDDMLLCPSCADRQGNVLPFPKR